VNCGAEANTKLWYRAKRRDERCRLNDNDGAGGDRGDGLIPFRAELNFHVLAICLAWATNRD